jgi:hypothetical protein
MSLGGTASFRAYPQAYDEDFFGTPETLFFRAGDNLGRDGMSGKWNGPPWGKVGRLKEFEETGWRTWLR